MIVDLERNDLGRICEPGSVAWPELMRARPMAGVEHLVSLVEGTGAADVGCADAMHAMFPGGSVSGAPKIAALDHINALEPVGRGASMGALGTVWPNGDFELALTIRTFAVVEGRIHLWVGGGVVWDSDPRPRSRSRGSRRGPCSTLSDAASRTWARHEAGLAPLTVGVLGRGVVDPEVPVIHADDTGLLRGLAAFETLRVYDGRPFAMAEHLERLRLSAARMQLPEPDVEGLAALAHEVLEAAGIADCSLRFTMTGGRPDGRRSRWWRSCPSRATWRPREGGIAAVSLQLGTDPRLRKDAPWLLDGVKSTSYAVNMAAFDEARRRGADDAVFIAADGSVLEGPVTNVWWRRGRALHAVAGPGHPGWRDPGPRDPHRA